MRNLIITPKQETCKLLSRDKKSKRFQNIQTTILIQEEFNALVCKIASIESSVIPKLKTILHNYKNNIITDNTKYYNRLHKNISEIDTHNNVILDSYKCDKSTKFISMTYHRRKYNITPHTTKQSKYFSLNYNILLILSDITLWIKNFSRSPFKIKTNILCYVLINFEHKQ